MRLSAQCACPAQQSRRRLPPPHVTSRARARSCSPSPPHPLAAPRRYRPSGWIRSPPWPPLSSSSSIRPRVPLPLSFPTSPEALAAAAARFRGHRASRASIWSSPSSSSSSTSPTPSGPSRAPLLRPERARLQPSDRRRSSPIPATSRPPRAHCHSLRLRCELPLLLPLSVSSPTFRSRCFHRRPKPTPQQSSSSSSSSMSCSPELATVL